MKRIILLLPIIFFIFFAPFCLAGCKQEENSTKEFHHTNPEFLVLMYLAGDSNDIYKNLRQNIIDVSKGLGANSSSSIQAAALYDGPPEGDTRIYKILSNRNATTIDNATQDVSYTAEWLLDGEADTGSAETLKNFLLWSKEYYSAEKIIFIFGTHGFGFSVEEDTTSASNQDLTQRSLAPDFNAGYSIIYSDQIAAAFEAAGFCGANKINLLLMDVCLEGSIEEAYELRDTADFLIASENEIPGAGMPYENFIASISTGKNSKSIGTTLVNLYAEKYQATSYSSWWNGFPSLSLIHLGNMTHLEAAVSSLSDFLTGETEIDFLTPLNTNSFLRTAEKAGNFQNNITFRCMYYTTKKQGISPQNYLAPYFYQFDIGVLTDKLEGYAESIESETEEKERCISELADRIENLRAALEKTIIKSWCGDGETEKGLYPTLNTNRNYYGLSITGNAEKYTSAYYKHSYYNPYAVSEFAFKRDSTWGTLLEMLFPEEWE